MKAATVLPALAMAALLAAPGTARADLTADQAKTLETQLHDWMASLVKPALDVGERPVQVSPEGDHYRLLLPLPEILSAMGFLEPGVQLSMTAKPMDGGRWALEDLRFPSPLRVQVPSKGPDGKPMQMPLEISVATQEYHAVFDPSYATTSSFDTAVTGTRVVTPVSTTTIAKSTGHSVWQPTLDGRLNVLAETGSDTTEAKATTPDGGTLVTTVAKTRTSLSIKGVSPGALATLVRSISALVPTLGGPQDKLTPPQRELARAVVFSLRDMIGGAEVTQTLEGMKVNGGGHTGTLAKISAGGAWATTDGKLELSGQMEFAGLDSPEVPKGLYRDYLPRKLTLKPRVSGIPSNDVIKLALRAIDIEAKDMPKLQQDAIALLAAGPLELAIDDLVLDMGAAKLAANGTFDIASPTDLTGDAEITVTGLNTLIKRANTAPELKDMTPVLIFLKGIGKQDGDDTTWTLAYEDGKFTVNDTDMSAMIPKK